MRKVLRSKEGYTLTELLVAVGIMALVFPVLLMALDAGIRSYEFTEGQAEVNQNVRIAMDRVVLELREAGEIDFNRSNAQELVLWYNVNPADEKFGKRIYRRNDNVLVVEILDKNGQPAEEKKPRLIASNITGFRVILPSRGDRYVTVEITSRDDSGRSITLRNGIYLRRDQ